MPWFVRVKGVDCFAYEMLLPNKLITIFRTWKGSLLTNKILKISKHRKIQKNEKRINAQGRGWDDVKDCSL